MRHAHQDVFFHLTENREPMGLALGYDWCAEHERGIARLTRLLGVPAVEYPMGVQDRLANPGEQARECIRFTEFAARLPCAPGSSKKTSTIPGARLIVSENLCSNWRANTESHQRWLANPKKPRAAYSFGTAKHQELNVDEFVSPSETTLASSDILVESQWGESGFDVTVWGAARVGALAEIHQALLKGQLTVSTGQSANPFGRGGLHLIIAARLPETFKQSVLDTDTAHQALRIALAETGIEAAIAKAGKGFYALSPRFWQDGEKKVLKCFLNPREQSKYNSGWFTIEELQDWLLEKGPVIKKA